MPHELQRLIESGRNLFITGRAGTGKTWLLKRLLELNRAKNVAVTAPTGMAAINCEGKTLHSTFWFPVRMSNLEASVIKKRGDKWFKEQDEKQPSWNMDLLFIDEISMFRADIFEALEKILRRFGPNPGASFGGVQIVLFGDPLQLPPIVKKLDRPWFNTPTRWNSEWFFSTAAFRDNNFHLHQLQYNHRQPDPEFAGLLDRVRLGEANKNDFAYLRSLCRPGIHDPRALHLFCRKKPVQVYNATALDKLHGQAAPFVAALNEWNGDDPVEQRITLKPGARVMLRANLNVAEGWANGTLGTVDSIDAETKQILMTRDDGAQIAVGLHTWTHELPRRPGENYRRTASFTQIPVELAWAFTIHKMQGQTVNGPVVLHPDNPFDYGQLYVGLSRVRRAEQLSITSPLPEQFLQPNRKAREFLRLRNALA
jgi:ATP-dependent DNA helicase PIF1